MNDYLKHYKIKLITEGPVFIGSGKEFSKKEYLFLSNGEKIGILDFAKFYGYIHDRKLSEKFEDFFINDYKSDLRCWIKENNISYDEIKKYLKYELDCGDTSLENGKKAQIMEFVKDVYGCPYIPGSSIKGMLRTILEAKYVSDNIDLFLTDKYKINDRLDNTYKPNKNILRIEEKNISVKSFNKLNKKKDKMEDAVNDILSRVIIGDSVPLDVNDLILCQKIEVHTDGREKNLNLLRECIKPGVSIEIPISIDTSKTTSNVKDINIDDIRNAIIGFNEIYKKCFTDAFNTNVDIRDETVFLGGGVGFVSKTMIYPLFGKNEGIDVSKKIFEKTGVPKEHKHFNDNRLGASPHILKCTRWNGRLYQIGQCKFEIG